MFQSFYIIYTIFQFFVSSNRTLHHFLDNLALYNIEIDTMPSGQETILLKRRFGDLQATLDKIRWLIFENTYI